MGHLDAVFRIFWYLKCALQNKRVARISFDPSIPEVDERLFNYFEVDHWRDFYPDAEEAIPDNVPTPRGRPIDMSCYVDANHAGNMMNRRSHSGVLLYLCNTPVIWYSKRQNTVEVSSFGSEFIALRVAEQMIEALRYKLRSFGVPINGPTNVFCDDRSVVTNSTIPSSTLNRKHNAICYHKVREAQAARIVRIAWIEGEYNKADILTKTTLGTGRRYDLINSIFEDECAVVFDESVAAEI